MSGIEDWLDLMTQTVVVERFLAADAYGKSNFAAPQTYQCRINFKTRHVPGDNGELRVARGTAWLATVDLITTRDRVTLPDGSLPLLLEVNQESDENGPLYTSLLFQ